MNWVEIDKSWEQFAKLNNTELKKSERNVLLAIECKYEVRVEKEYGTSIFSGVLWKSTEGHNRNKTKISTRFNSDMLDIELKGSSFVKALFHKPKTTNSETNILENLKALNSSSLIIKNNILNFELGQIISTNNDFERTLKLIAEIKDCYKS